MLADKSFYHLLYLLRLADGQPVEERVTLSPDEWREVYRFAAKHAVIAVAWDGVEQLQSAAPEALQSMPADVTGKWFADVQTIDAANRRLAKQAAAIQSRLNAAEFDSQILKGVALAAYYPRPAHRQSADIDLWIRQSNSPQASLKAQRQELLSYLRQQPDITIGETVYHHIETTIDGIEVEYHVTPTWLCNPRNNRRLQQLFADAPQVTPELQELYTLLHAFRHIYHDGIALRHVMDYHFVCHHNRLAGVQQPYDLYRQLGLAAFAGAMDEMTAAIFDKSEQQQLSKRAKHILEALPERQVSRAVRWDYPAETMFNLPWRIVHYLWRKMNRYV